MDLMYVFLILVIFALALWTWKLQLDKVEGLRETVALEKERDEYVKMGEGLVEFNEKVRERKGKIMGDILEMLEEKGGSKDAGRRVSNRDVAKKLGVARTSAFRYLDELEKQGKIKQVGKTGVNVIYTLA